MRIEYCQCCKVNHEQGRGHIYSNRHIKKLDEWSQRQKKRVADCLVLAQNGYANPNVEEHAFWCAFCSEEIRDSKPMIVGNCLNHLCSETHINSVYAFFRKNGTNNKSIDQKWFYIGEPFRDDYVERCKTLIHHNKTTTSIFATSSRSYGPIPPPKKELEKPITKEINQAKQFSSPLEEQLNTFSYDTLLHGLLRSDTYIKRDKSYPMTLISSSGIKQNVYGYTETGIRVWGGGIVKLSQREWKPWPIDLLLLQYQRKIEKERKEQLEIELAEEERKRALKEEESMKIYTTSATGEGLTCIPINPNVDGNIHSLALPPWLQPNETSSAMRAWKKAKEFEQRYRKKLRALDVGVVRGKKANEEWLPNFGGVWNSGSRRDGRVEFKSHQSKTQQSIGKESVVNALQRLINEGGEGMSEKEKNEIIQQSKEEVLRKIQIRMKQNK